jgi:hypothetical protein
MTKEIQGKCHEVDSLISDVKRLYLKAALRVQEFKEGTPSLPLQSQSVLAHWGMCLDVMCYFENHSTIEKTLLLLQSVGPAESH